MTSAFKRVIVFCLLLYSQVVSSQQIVYLNTAFGEPVSNESQTGFADQVVREALKRIGYQLVTTRLPAERALINANRGIDDGDLIRVAGLEKRYTNLIPVPETVMVIDMVLFTRNLSAFVVADWSSVKSHSLAIISGWKIMEKNFGKFSDQITIIKTDGADQSFALLLKDRVDFVAYSNWSGLGYLKKHSITNITLLQPPLASPKFYIYLHKKHKKIVPLLAASIKQMKSDGSYQALFNRLLRPYLQKEK